MDGRWMSSTACCSASRQSAAAMSTTFSFHRPPSCGPRRCRHPGPSNPSDWTRRTPRTTCPPHPHQGSSSGVLPRPRRSPVRPGRGSPAAAPSAGRTSGTTTTMRPCLRPCRPGPGRRSSCNTSSGGCDIHQWTRSVSWLRHPTRVRAGPGTPEPPAAGDYTHTRLRTGPGVLVACFSHLGIPHPLAHGTGAAACRRSGDPRWRGGRTGQHPIGPGR